MRPGRRSAKFKKFGAGWRDLTVIYKLFFGACIALITFGGAAVAWNNLGARRAVPALIGYVDDTIDDRVGPIRSAQTRFETFIQSSQVTQMEGQLAGLQGELVKWQAELPKTINQNTRSLIQARIKALDEQIRQLTDNIKNLRNPSPK